MNPADQYTIDCVILGSGFFLLTFSTLQLFAHETVWVIPLIAGVLLLTLGPTVTAWAYGYGREAYHQFNDENESTPS